MPKMKTSRAAAKRFKATGTGKLKRSKAYKSHILTRSSPASSAIFRASLEETIPSCSPSSPISRTSLSLICSLIIKSLMVVYLHKKMC